MSFTSVDFPEPDTPVTTVNNPSGRVTSTSFKLLACAPRIWIVLPFGLRRFDWHGNFDGARKIAPGQRLRSGSDFLWLAGGNQVASGITGARSKVDNIIGAANGVFIMLDDENGIAEIAQLFQRMKQAIIVSRVQSNRRLIQNIQDAAKA